MRILAALFWILIAHNAFAASSIDPTIPPNGAPYAPAPIRLNFGHAISDINALQTMNAGASPPSNPTAGYLWLQTLQNATTFNLKIWDGGAWLPLASLDTVTHTWIPPIGGGVLPFILSGVTTDLGSVPQAAVYVTGSNPIQLFGATAPIGAVKLIIFTGTPTLIFNSVSLILPGTANITQAIGDTAIALHLGNGNWQVLFDSRTSGGGGGSGCSGGTCQFPLGEGFTVTPGTDNATPLTLGTNTLYGQIVPVNYAAPHTVTALEMGHLITTSGSVPVPIQLPVAGTTGFEKGTSVCFEADGAGGMTLAATGPSILLGIATSSGTGSLPQFGSACATSDGTNWHISSSSTANNLPTLTNAHIFVGNISNVATDVAVSGDLAAANTGAFTVTHVNAVAYPALPSLNTVPVVTSTTSGGAVTYETIPNAALTNSSTTVNGQTCVLGGSCTIVASPGSLGNTHIFVGNASNVATDVPVSGDLSVLNTGAFTVQKVNAVTYPAGPNVNTVPVVTNAAAGGTVTYESVPNVALQFSSITIAGHSVSLGGTQAVACGDLSNSGTACQANTGTSGHNVPFLDGNNTWSGGNAVTPVALTDAATIAVNAALGNTFTVTLGGNRTLGNPTNLLAGQTMLFAITQDGTGSRTLSYSSNYKWPSGNAPTLTTAANAKDVINCWSDTNATLNCAASLNVH